MGAWAGRAGAIGVVALLVAVVAGCTSGGGREEGMTPLSAAVDLAPTGSGGAAGDADPGATGATGATTSSMVVTPTPPSPSTQTTPTRTTPSAPTTLPYPGGRIAGEMLTARGWIGADGAFRLGAADRTDTPGLADAVCSYLVGTPAEVADLTGLAAPVTLDPASGLADGPTAPLVLCLYRAAGTPTLAVQVVAGSPLDADAPGDPVVVTRGELHAALSYSPDHDGPRLATAAATAWLHQVLALVAGR